MAYHMDALISNSSALSQTPVAIMRGVPVYCRTYAGGTKIFSIHL